MNGNWFLNQIHAWLNQYIYSNGLPIGNSKLIPVKQKIKPSTLWFDASLSEEKRLNEVLFGRETYPLTYNIYLDSKN